MAVIPASLAEPVVQHRDALAVGTRLAEFEVQGLLGVGGFGLVYRAYDHSLHRTVAIKEYMPSALAGRVGQAVATRSPADQAAFRAGLTSFMAEARLLAQFDHPSLVKVFRVWEQNETAYIAMRCYQGMTLQQAYAQMRSPPSEAWLRTLLWSLLQALQVLHEHQMVHRDLSPDNIFLQDIGHPVLLDLGAARHAIGEHTQQHAAILKVHYAPLEQFADAEDLRQGPWSDLYALAAVVHGCLRRAPPLPATFRVLRDRLPTMGAVTASLQMQFGLLYSRAFVDTLTQALAIQPADRPQNVAALVSGLQLTAPAAPERFDWRAALGVAWQPPAVVASPVKPVQRSRPAPAPGPAEAIGGVVTARGSRDPVLAPAPDGPLGPLRRRAAVFWVAGGAALVALMVGAMVLVPQAPTSSHPAAGALSTALSKPVTQGHQAAARALPSSGDSAALDAAPVVGAFGAASEPAAAQNADSQRPEPKLPTRQRARAQSAQDICPDSNFFTRPMCLHRACQQARYAALPVCIENSRRLRESRPHEGA